MGQHDPADCHVCGRRAIGVGFSERRPEDNKYLCAECVPLLEYVKSVRRWDPYELKARHGGMEAAAPLVQEYGPDLSQWEEEQVLMFVGAVWRGCADEMRRLIKTDSAPF